MKNFQKYPLTLAVEIMLKISPINEQYIFSPIAKYNLETALLYMHYNSPTDFVSSSRYFSFIFHYFLTNETRYRSSRKFSFDIIGHRINEICNATEQERIMFDLCSFIFLVFCFCYFFFFFHSLFLFFPPSSVRFHVVDRGSYQRPYCK